MKIEPGKTISVPNLSEPVEVNVVENLGAYTRIIGVNLYTRKHFDRIFSKEDLDALLPAQDIKPFAANPRHVFLALETGRYRFASLYDPLLAMNTCKIDPLPHQIEAVYGYVLKLPRIRFLIADDPGAGKTIMAGLIIKELKLRHQAKRILIVVPGHLKDQWQRELKERFEEVFTLVDRDIMGALFGVNVWEREMQIITSLDFAKQEDILPALSSVHYDLVVVDEAHKMSAYRYNQKLEKTSRYRLGEVLSNCSNHLLFLTATPHRGDPENFRLFLDLLEPGFFADTQMVAESIQNRDNPLFIRRVKEDLKDFQGRPLFLPRHVETKSFRLGVESPAEMELYNELSQYVNKQYNRALTKDRRRNVAFALVILQRRLASSTYALLRSLERRKKRLEELIRGAQISRAEEQGLDFEEIEDLSEEERWKQEELWETLSVAETRQELEAEIRTLDKLIQKAKQIITSEGGGEIKLRHLKTALAELDRQYPGAKILIFTESRDTLDYLEDSLRRWGYSVCSIHGGMRLEERIKAEAVFKNEARVMVATEAAGEGINLQFCNLMINFDIPWNPNRLEQRMGRIHRYGQTREVFIFNLVASDTREGKVLTLLFRKLQEIKEALGSDKVFDVIGDVIYGKNLSQLLIEAAANARNLDDILREIDVQVDAEYISRVSESLGESLATRYIDFTRIREMADQAREHRLIPEYTEAFFKKAMETAGGRWQTRQVKGRTYLSIESIPSPWRKAADENEFKHRYGVLLRRYPLVTFDKETAQHNPEAEFVTFGHPLFEAALAWVERDLSSALQQGAVFTDPDGRLDGVLLFYQGEIRDGRDEIAGTRLFALFVNAQDNQIQPVNPAILWDLKEGPPPSSTSSPLDIENENIDLEALKQKALYSLLPKLETYRQELLQERQRQAKIKEKYGKTSLESLILKLDGDLIHLYDRRGRGENVDLAIRNKETQKHGYEQALASLQRELEQECHLMISTPRFVGMVRVVPDRMPAEMVSNAEIERIGMEVAMQYERQQGRTPEDVSAQNLGFDVRSTDKEGKKRYIEVKARADVGPVALTQNEWFKAQRFQEDYYLYVVLNAAHDPQLFCIQNPAAVLQPEELREVRYLISPDQFTKK